MFGLLQENKPAEETPPVSSWCCFKLIRWEFIKDNVKVMLSGNSKGSPREEMKCECVHDQVVSKLHMVFLEAVVT